jgi:hypothetical protein
MKLWNSIVSDWVEPEQWQLELKIGDYYAIYPNRIVMGKQYVPAPTVYGRITGNENCAPGFFIVLVYSQWSPQGEVDELCICEATHLLTEEQYRQAQKAVWPELAEILEKE